MYSMHFCRYRMMVTTDSQGRILGLQEYNLIMTSNIGSPYLLDGIDENGNHEEA